MMKQITFTTRSRNYTQNGTNSIKGLSGSVSHSFRVNENLTHKINHEPDKTDKNQYVIFDGLGYSAVSAEEANKHTTALADRNISKTFASGEDLDNKNNLKKIHKQLTKIRKKFKTYKCDGEEKDLWIKLANPANDEEKVKQIKSELSSKIESRFDQKMNQIDNYLSKMSEAESAPKMELKGNNLGTIIQETFFKIPLHNGIGSDEVTPEDYINFAIEFNRKVNPDHQLASMAVHVDENGTSQKGEGIHIHTFTSGFNARGEANLLATQFEYAEKFCEKNAPELLKAWREDYEAKSKLCMDNLKSEENVNNSERIIETESAELGSLRGQFFGRIWQETVRQEINSSLFNKKDLNAEFNYGSRDNMKLKVDQQKPSALKQFNSLNMREEKINKLTNEVNLKKSESNRLSKDIKNKVDYINKVNKKGRETVSKINSKSEELESINRSIDDSKVRYKAAEEEHKDNIKNTFKTYLDKIGKLMKATINSIASSNDLKEVEKITDKLADNIISQTEESAMECVNAFTASNKSVLDSNEIVSAKDNFEKKLFESVKPKIDDFSKSTNSNVSKSVSRKFR